MGEAMNLPLPLEAQLLAQFMAQTPRRMIPEYTLATLPAANAVVRGSEVIVLDFAGGSRWRSNGTRWRPVSACLTIGEMNTQVLVGATTALTALYSVLLPAPLIGPNDRVEFFVHAVRNATTAQTTYRLLLGGTGTDGALVSVRTEIGSTIIGVPMVFGFACANSLYAQKGFGAGSFGGTSVANQNTTVDLSVSQYVHLAVQKTNIGDVAGTDIISARLFRGVA